LPEGHGIEIRRVASNRAFIVGAAVSVIEYRPRNPPPRELAQILDIENHSI
jgi:hypothetical protein